MDFFSTLCKLDRPFLTSMRDTVVTIHYFRFMKWFKTNHPALFAKYQLNIKVPTEENKITAAMDYVEPEDREVLQAVIDQYYMEVAD